MYKKLLLNCPNFWGGYSTCNDFSLGDAEVYTTHPYYAKYPYVGICQEDAELYIEWIQKLDSTKSYFIPSRLDYLAIYSIRLEEALQSTFLCGAPKDNTQVIKDTLQYGGTLNRDYFPWGVSIYGPKNEILANIYVPIEYRIVGQNRFFRFNSEFKKSFEFGKILPGGSMPFNFKNIYDLQGNVAELLVDSCFTFGGSFKEEAYSGLIGRVTKKKDVPFDVGFRLFAKPKKP